MPESYKTILPCAPQAFATPRPNKHQNPAWSSERFQDSKPSARAEREFVEDVREAIADFVGLIKTYKSKNKLSKVLTSSLFRRRQEEADAAIHRALTRLNVSFCHTSLSAEEGPY